MKIFFMFFTIFLLCQPHSANAVTTKVTCPIGSFCTHNGEYISSAYADGSEYKPISSSIPAILISAYSRYGNVVISTSGGTICGNRHIKDANVVCTYIIEDYDEAWECKWGFYLVKNDEVMHIPLTSSKNGIYACPGTYPTSDSGASSVFQCYRTNRDGQKEYYTPNKRQTNYDGNYNTDDVNTILINLVSAIEQANTATQNLQAILKKSNDKIEVTDSIKNIWLDPEKLINTTSDATQALENKSITTAATLKTTNTKTNTTSPTVAEKSDTKSDTSDTTKKFDFSSFLSPFSDRAAQMQIRQPIQPTRKKITQPQKTNKQRSTRILTKRQNLNAVKNIRQNTKTKINDSQNNKNQRPSITH